MLSLFEKSVASAPSETYARLLKSATAKREYVELMPPWTVKDERNRFTVWCSNLGALQAGPSSLDYRLRDAEDMQASVMIFLQELCEELEQSKRHSKRCPCESAPS
jgi:hypothetical protein